MARRAMDVQLRAARDCLIEDLYATGDYTHRDLAAIFNLHRSAIGYIVSEAYREASRARLREHNRGPVAAAAQRRRRAARRRREAEPGDGA